jgi:hypothetical protein
MHYSGSMKNILAFNYIRIMLYLLIVSTLRVTPVSAQQSPTWKTPQIIPGLTDTTVNQYPVFVADGTGRIHVFHSQNVGGVETIVYSQWVEGVGWTVPIDIVVSPRQHARVSGVLLDKSGVMHMVFWGGDDLAADMYYTRAPAALAGRAMEWETPVIIGKSAIAPTTAELVGDGEGFLGIVYSGNIEGNGLYLLRSSDSGKTWSKPEPIFLTNSDRLWPYGIQLYRDQKGFVYAVWALANEAGNSLAVYFSSMRPEFDQWSDPLILAEGNGFDAATPSIIEHDGELFVIYHYAFPTTRWTRRSSDGGKSWSAPVRLFQQVGSNGHAALAVDSGGTLHMFFGNRVGNPIIHGLWHSVWLGHAWSVPEPIVSGPQVRGGPNGEEGFDPSQAQAMVSRGNLLFVAWRHDPQAGPKNIWYTYQFLDAPQYPEETLVAQTASPTFTLDAAMTQTISLDNPVILDRDYPVSGESDDFELSRAIIIGLIPATLIIVGIFLIQRIRR